MAPAPEGPRSSVPGSAASAPPASSPRHRSTWCWWTATTTTRSSRCSTRWRPTCSTPRPSAIPIREYVDKQHEPALRHCQASSGIDLDSRTVHLRGLGRPALRLPGRRPRGAGQLLRYRRSRRARLPAVHPERRRPSSRTTCSSSSRRRSSSTRGRAAPELSTSSSWAAGRPAWRPPARWPSCSTRRLSKDCADAIRSADATITLVEHGDRLLKMFDEGMSAYTKEALEERGVTVRLGESVAEIDADSVTLGSGEVLNAHTTVWGAGLTDQPPRRRPQRRPPARAGPGGPDAQPGGPSRGVRGGRPGLDHRRQDRRGPPPARLGGAAGRRARRQDHRPDSAQAQGPGAVPLPGQGHHGHDRAGRGGGGGPARHPPHRQARVPGVGRGAPGAAQRRRQQVGGTHQLVLDRTPTTTVRHGCSSIPTRRTDHGRQDRGLRHHRRHPDGGSGVPQRFDRLVLRSPDRLRCAASLPCSANPSTDDGSSPRQGEITSTTRSYEPTPWCWRRFTRPRPARWP